MKRVFLSALAVFVMASSGYGAGSPPEGIALVVHGMDSLSPWEKITFTCLQGIANRDRPAVYLMLDGENDRLWLNWYVDQYGLETKTLEHPYDLFQYEWPLAGLCVMDPESKHTGNLAANYAAADLLPVTRETLDSHPDLSSLAVKRDLRDLPSELSPSQAYAWAYEHQWCKLDYNRAVAGVAMAPDASLSPFWRRQYIRDYVVAKRGFLFELSADPKHADEYALREKYLAEMNDWGYLMGWHVDRDKEPQHVEQATKHHQLVLCSISRRACWTISMRRRQKKTS